VSELAHVIVPILIIVVGLLIVRLQNILAAILALGILSLLVSLEFYALRAPDVAITEAAVNAALGTAIFLIALKGVSARKGAD